MSAEPAKLSAADEAASLVQPDPSTKVYQRRQKNQSSYSSLIIFFVFECVAYNPQGL